MTQSSEQISTSQGPEGSIFLPKTKHPEREFETWRLELLLGRGVGKDILPEERYAADKELQRERARHIGAQAIGEV